MLSWLLKKVLEIYIFGINLNVSYESANCKPTWLASDTIGQVTKLSFSSYCHWTNLVEVLNTGMTSILASSKVLLIWNLGVRNLCDGHIFSFRLLDLMDYVWVGSLHVQTTYQILSSSTCLFFLFFYKLFIINVYKCSPFDYKWWAITFARVVTRQVMVQGIWRCMYCVLLNMREKVHLLSLMEWLEQHYM